MMRPSFTLHVRLTRRCNADCAYCSSRSDHKGYMTASEYRRSAEYILELLENPSFGGIHRNGQIHIQYIGGEILTIPKRQLREIVTVGREVFSGYFSHVVDGTQSNLVGPPDRISNLQALFGKRISTSIDSFGNKRTLNGSAELYRKTIRISLDSLKRRSFNPAAIVVVDQDSLPYLDSEIAVSEEAGRPMRLRPVFHGGSPISPAEPSAMAERFGKACSSWLMNSRISVDPFMQLLLLRLAEVDGGAGTQSSGCPFSDNCAHESLNLDPDGSLYVCLDMADAGLMPLGNALAREFDWGIHQGIAKRYGNLHPDCQACQWRVSCRGGCTMEAIQHSGQIDGKTPLCGTWQSCFSAIDDAIARHGPANVRAWSEGLVGMEGGI